MERSKEKKCVCPECLDMKEVYDGDDDVIRPCPNLIDGVCVFEDETEED